MGKRNNKIPALSLLGVTVILQFSLSEAMRTMPPHHPVPSPSTTPAMMIIRSPGPPNSSPVVVRRVPKQVGYVGGAIIHGDQQPAAGYHHDHHHGYGHHGMGGGGGGMGMGGGGGMMGMGAGHGDSKYFQYAHNPHYDEYEYGYRRGNDYHFQERYEKYGPAWKFKTKVKYGDHKGHAYGEHYWDYNHADSHHDDGHGQSYGHDGQGSDPVANYETQSTDKKSSYLAKRENQRNLMRRPKFEDNQASPSAPTPKRRDFGRYQSQIPKPTPNLALDTRSGQVIDESTGKAYYLKPAV